MNEMTRSLDDLDVVGYADPPTAELLPSILTPVFRCRSGTAEFILPPHRIQGTSLLGGQTDSEEAFRQLETQGHIQRLAQPQPAKADFVLWIDSDCSVKYEPRKTVRESLQKHAQECIDLAFSALSDRRFNDALDMAQSALSADENSYDAVVVKAVVYTIQKDSTLVDELRQLAKAIDPRHGFDDAVKYAARVVPGAQTPTRKEFFVTELAEIAILLQRAGISAPATGN
jgi:hypothetical protein